MVGGIQRGEGGGGWKGEGTKGVWNRTTQSGHHAKKERYAVQAISKMGDKKIKKGKLRLIVSDSGDSLDQKGGARR